MALSKSRWKRFAESKFPHEVEALDGFFDLTIDSGGNDITLIGSLGGNIVEVEHNRWFQDVPARMTGVDFLVEIRRASDADVIVQGIASQGLKVRRLSSDAVED